MLAENLLSQNGFAQNKFSKHQLHLLEAGLFTFICEELKDYFAEAYKKYFRLLKTINQQEYHMIEEPLAKCVVNDIISSGTYTLSGIAYYTHSSEDVVFDIASGLNRDPSTTLFSKLIKLHQTVRPELYKEMMKKITSG